MFFRKENEGITLIALVITIIVLLILAEITIATLTGDNGILTKTNEAKEGTEIAEEKEQIRIAVTQSIAENKSNKLEKQSLQSALNNNVGENKTKVYLDDEDFLIEYIEKNRRYRVNNIGEVKQENSEKNIIDEIPGKFDGSGTSSDPYVIMSVEDLVQLSKNGSEGNSYRGQTIILGKDISFTSELSYVNSETREYNEFLGVTDDVGLMEALTNTSYNGFMPIKNFSGNFDGKEHWIKNIYINRNYASGLFSSILSGIKISNIRISGNIQSTSAVGSIVGYLGPNGQTAYITNCINYCNVKRVSGTREDPSFLVDLCTGGIIGVTKSGTAQQIDRCVNYGKIENDDVAGGIIGLNQNELGARIKNCYNYGNIKASRVGGICGRNSHYVYNSCNFGKIEGEQAGGITAFLGWAATEFYNCYNVGEIIGSNNNIGGIVGTSNISDQLLKTNSLYMLNIENQSSLNKSRGTIKTIEELKSKEFVDKLNSFIENNTDEIDTTGYYKWLYKENEYPALNFNEYWDGSNWVQIK